MVRVVLSTPAASDTVPEGKAPPKSLTSTGDPPTPETCQSAVTSELLRPWRVIRKRTLVLPVFPSARIGSSGLMLSCASSLLMIELALPLSGLIVVPWLGPYSVTL